jgi:hypothetical protein
MRRFIFAAAVTAAAIMALAASASADVARYQPTATLTVSLDDHPYTHTYTIAWANPCDVGGAFTGTGGIASLDLVESIGGTLVGDDLAFSAVYSTFNEGYTWNESMFAIHWDVAPITTWKNHGQYVKETGGGSEAGQSCLGKPIPYSWSQSGVVASTLAGESVTLPVAGRYQIDVTGTWTNGGYGWVDAEYTNDGAGGYADGFDRNGYLLGPNFGDLMVAGAFVDWGAYDDDHAYSYTGSFTAGALNLGLAVFDGEAGVPLAGWYGDNTGWLDYTITYVGP